MEWPCSSEPLELQVNSAENPSKLLLTSGVLRTVGKIWFSNCRNAAVMIFSTQKVKGRIYSVHMDNVTKREKKAGKKGI